MGRFPEPITKAACLEVNSYLLKDCIFQGVGANWLEKFKLPPGRRAPFGHSGCHLSFARSAAQCLVPRHRKPERLSLPKLLSFAS
jgi:hypothetical protein